MADAKNNRAKGRLKELDKMAKAAHTVVKLKRLVFVPGADNALLGLGREATKLAGMELTLVQAGEMPTDFDSIFELGPGTYEIRLQTGGQWIRVFYVASFSDAIYMLDAVEKKQNQLPQVDKDRIKQRYAMAKSMSAAVVTAAKKSAAKSSGAPKPKAKAVKGRKGK